MKISDKFVGQILHIALEAGRAILDVYNREFEVDYKADLSPITEADRRAHAIIRDGLSALPEKLPILSEEADLPSIKERQGWPLYWLIDPLDGTKEFVKHNGEFTVNIALVKAMPSSEGGQVWVPVFGLVYAPLQDDAYVGWPYDDYTNSIMPGQAYRLRHVSDLNSYWREKAYELIPITIIEHANMPVRALSSRSHVTVETEVFLQKVEDIVGTLEIVNLGSSLKMCKIAAGYAHFYPRFGPSMEWDTAAADGICRAVGVAVMDVNTCQPLAYNKDDLTNPGFLVTAIQTMKDFLCDPTS